MNSYYDAFNGTKEIIQFPEEWYGDRAERWGMQNLSTEDFLIIEW